MTTAKTTRIATRFRLSVAAAALVLSANADAFAQLNEEGPGTGQENGGLVLDRGAAVNDNPGRGALDRRFGRDGRDRSWPSRSRLPALLVRQQT